MKTSFSIKNVCKLNADCGKSKVNECKQNAQKELCTLS
jgi:hypothetical protein